MCFPSLTRFPSCRRRSLLRRESRKKNPGNEAAIPFRRCSDCSADGGSALLACVRAKFPPGCANSSTATAPGTTVKTSTTDATESSECRASRHQPWKPARRRKPEQSAPEGRRTAPGDASGPAGEILAEQSALPEPAPGSTSADSSESPGLEQADALAAAGLA